MKEYIVLSLFMCLSIVMERRSSQNTVHESLINRHYFKTLFHGIITLLHSTYNPSLLHYKPLPSPHRLQEIGGALETSLATAAAGPAVWTALLRCWSRGVFLRPLTHRFWQLTLQVVSRYCTWLASKLDDEVGGVTDRGRVEWG